MHAQDTGAVVVRGDSVTFRFIDSDIRAVVQALGQYLEWPLVITGLQNSRVTFETPRPVLRSAVLPLLRSLLETQNLELLPDSVGSIYRIRPREQPARGGGQPGGAAVAGGPPGQGPAQAAQTLQLYVIRLRHARADDVAATVNALYGRASALGEIGTRPSTLTNELRDQRVPSAQAPPQAVAGVAGVVATLAGEVTIVPDAGTNSLMIRASQRDFELIEAAVQQLDVRPLQVLIEVLIVEVRKDRGFSFGVSAELPETRIPDTKNATVSATTTGIGLGDFVVKVMNIGGVDIDATLTAAAARGDVSIVSRPIVLAANNELAEILVGSQRPFVQVSRSLPTDTPQRDQVIQYKDVGTQLNVRPTISAEGYVMLEVTQEVNAVTTETAFDAPVISTRSVQTRLLVRDGQTAVLGGLADRQRDSNQEGVPVLSSIPILGGLFGRVSRRTTETELFLFLTPRVLYTDTDVDEATEQLRPPPGEEIDQ
jgi:general secretion pathway protein D